MAPFNQGTARCPAKSANNFAKVFLAATVELEKVTQEIEDFWSDAFPRVVTEAYAACEKARLDGFLAGTSQFFAFALPKGSL
jgi:hypothetical protein